MEQLIVACKRHGCVIGGGEQLLKGMHRDAQHALLRIKIVILNRLCREPEKEKGNQRAGGQGDAGDCDQHLGAEAEGFVDSIILLKNRMFSHGVR